MSSRLKKSNKMEPIIDPSSDPLSSALVMPNNLSLSPPDVAVDLRCCKPHDLSQDVLHDVFMILKENMQPLYDVSSWGWNDEKKWTEAFSSKAWLILSYASTSLALPTTLCGFVSFRFERECKDAVLYCYEIQLRNEFRGLSIGRHLISALTLIANCFKMRRIMLTVFKFNTKALDFFFKCGFEIDKSDPSHFDGNPVVDYHILSMTVP
ncbi:unnamed protein product [Dicrocoelium dendriticum]|nr:unnamed protein product [Dicrocoelium dendriticum]